MSILQTLFSKKQLPENEETTFVLTDIVLDWFKKGNLNINDFEAQHLSVMIDGARANKYVDEYFLTKPEEAGHIYFDAFGIAYLAYHAPDNAMFSSIVDILFNKTGRHIYRVKEIVTGSGDWDWGRQVIQEFTVYDTGRRILAAYYAIHIRQDANFSTIGRLAYTLGEAQYLKDPRCFDNFFSYVTKQSFREKVFVMLEVYRREKLDHEPGGGFSNREQIKQALAESIAENNGTQPIALDLGILIAFTGFLSYKKAETWRKTDYKKRRFLKVKDFEECQQFIAYSRGKEQDVLQNVIYCLGNTYIGSEEEKLFTDAVTQIIGKHKFPAQWIAFMMDVAHTSSEKFFMDNIYVPLISKLKDELEYTDPLIAALEKRVFVSPVSFGDVFPMLREIASRIPAEDERNITLSRLSPCFVQLVEGYRDYIPELQMDTSDKKFPVVKSLVDGLNTIVPVALKGVEKNHYYIDEPRNFFTLNFKNRDVGITSEFVKEINDLLFDEGTGYQLMPIPVSILESKNKKPDGLDPYMASLAYVSFAEFNLIKDTYLKHHFPAAIKSNLYNKIRFAKLDAPPFRSLKEQANTKKESQTVVNSFLEDINWKWFKEKYIDQLRSHDHWYTIMDVVVQCSGGKKPAPQWLKDVAQKIEPLGTETYFRELQVLLADSLKEEFWYFDTYRNALKGLIWTCTHLDPTDESLNIVKLVVETAYTKIPGVGPKSGALGNVALDALVESGKEEAFGLITVMLNKTRYSRFSDVLGKYIDKFKATSEVPEELLADRSIPKFGLETGEKTIAAGPYLVRIQFVDEKLKKTWIGTAGNVLKSTPTDLDPKVTKEINEESKQINQVFTDLKKRLRLYWLHNRVWKAEHWRSNVLEHPLIYPHLVNQIWTNITQKIDFIVQDRQPFTIAGKQHHLNDGDEIVFWHPVLSAAENVDQWQEYVWSNNIVQRERQVFREHYPFSEKESGDNQTVRFAHHFLEVNKLMAIAASAGWTFTYVHEGWSWPRIYIKPLNITAHLNCDYDRNDFAIPTKELFFTTGDTTKINDGKTKLERIAINDVPKVTLSEICRDIDLFIAKTSVSNNPELSSNRQEMNSYRMDYQKGLFSDNATAKVRRRIIDKLGPVLKIRSSGFEGNYWIIRGNINEYRINLGSGFAQIRESQKHINILPDIKKIKSNKKLQLPIEDDDTLYVILAKGLFLQDDDKIMDEEIRTLLN